MALHSTTAAIVLSIMAMFLISDHGLVSGQGCQGDVQGLISQCAMYVQKAGLPTDPSDACCDVVQHVDFPCVCKYITSEVEQMIDMNKVAHVAAVCKKPLAPGTKCGSYVATPAGQVYDEVSEALSPSEESEAPSVSMEASYASRAFAAGPGGVGEAPFPSEDESSWAKYYIWK